MAYYVVQREWGKSAFGIYGWTSQQYILRLLLEHSKVSMKVIAYDCNFDEFMDIMFDEYSIAPSDIKNNEIKILTTKCGRNGLSSKVELEQVLHDVSYVFNMVDELSMSAHQLQILAPYIKDDVKLFIQYLIKNHVYDIIQSYYNQDMEIDVHNGYVDIVALMIKEGCIVEV